MHEITYNKEHYNNNNNNIILWWSGLLRISGDIIRAKCDCLNRVTIWMIASQYQWCEKENSLHSPDSWNRVNVVKYVYLHIHIYRIPIQDLKAKNSKSWRTISVLLPFHTMFAWKSMCVPQQHDVIRESRQNILYHIYQTI